MLCHFCDTLTKGRDSSLVKGEINTLLSQQCWCKGQVCKNEAQKHEALCLMVLLQEKCTPALRFYYNQLLCNTHSNGGHRLSRLSSFAAGLTIPAYTLYFYVHVICACVCGACARVRAWVLVLWLTGI